MLQYIMELFLKTFKAFLSLPFKKTTIYNFGPNTLDELLKQFDQPKKEKTKDDIIRDYKVKETLAALEVDMLRMEPANNYRGHHIWFDNEGNKFYDWVLCVVRPEVLYCSYGKN